MFYTLITKTWVFDQSESAQGPIYILMENTPLVKFIQNYITQVVYFPYLHLSD